MAKNIFNYKNAILLLHTPSIAKLTLPLKKIHEKKVFTTNTTQNAL